MAESSVNFKILPMTSDHIAAVTAIEKSVFPDPWSAESFFEAMSFSDKCWVVRSKKNLIGYLMTQWVMDEIHILNIAVAPEIQRKGIGNLLLEYLVNQGYLNGMKEIFLEVRVSNKSAQALYARFGFSVLTTRKKYYRDGEDAFIMHCLIPDDASLTGKISREGESSDILR